jgi:hypothetical protein
MALNLKTARELCNKSEWELVKASKRDEIGQLTEAQLKRHVVRARTMRDKWRDLAVAQRRKTQKEQQARTTQANARSAEKAEVFDEVLARFEKQLQRVASSSPSTGGASARKTPPKQVRLEEHRATRSKVRKKLAGKRAKLDEQTVLGAPESAASAPSEAPASTSEPAISPTLKKKVRKVAKKGTTKSQATQKATKKKSHGKSDQLNRSGQQSARTAAKDARFAQSGLDSRTRGHVSARGKRTQSRRDSRR